MRAVCRFVCPQAAATPHFLYISYRAWKAPTRLLLSGGGSPLTGFRFLLRLRRVVRDKIQLSIISSPLEQLVNMLKSRRSLTSYIFSLYPSYLRRTKFLKHKLPARTAARAVLLLSLWSLLLLLLSLLLLSLLLWLSSDLIKNPGRHRGVGE